MPAPVESWNTNAITVRMSTETIEAAAAFRDLLDEIKDVALHPWKRADRNPFPTMHPFPLLDRLTEAATEAHDRIAAAWDTLRHGTDDDRW